MDPQSPPIEGGYPRIQTTRITVDKVQEGVGLRERLRTGGGRGRCWSCSPLEVFVHLEGVHVDRRYGASSGLILPGGLSTSVHSS